MRNAGAHSLFFVLFLVLLNPVKAQLVVMDTVQGPRLVHGRVVVAGTNQSVQNPNILVKDAADRTVFGGLGSDTGEFRFAPPTDGGRLTFTVTSIGFGTLVADVEPPGEGTLLVRIGMQTQPVEVEGIEATARSHRLVSEISFRGFQQRMRSNRGTFFDRAEIELRRPTELTDIVRRAPGLTVIRANGREVDVKIFKSQGYTFINFGKPCFPDVWLNGVLVREGFVALRPEPGQLYLNDIVDPDFVAGIEVYTGPAQIPIQFRGSSSMCGVIVIWSQK